MIIPSKLLIGKSVKGPWQEHKATWKHCTGCPLSVLRNRVVLARGRLPADVLVIGGGPGESEDILGFPFRGEDGPLMESILEKSVPRGLRIAFTNIVGCIPNGAEDRTTVELRNPTAKEAKSCRPRLVEFIRLANPRLVVLLGPVAKRSFPKEDFPDVAVVHMDHPVKILDMVPASAQIAVKRSILSIKDKVKGLR